MWTRWRTANRLSFLFQSLPRQFPQQASKQGSVKMKGHIRPRGTGAWELKYDVVSDTGQRKTRYATVRGGKREAQNRLTELLAQANKGISVQPSKETVG